MTNNLSNIVYSNTSYKYKKMIENYHKLHWKELSDLK